MATAISTSMQEYQGFDTYFLYNKGSGELYYDEHKAVYDEYNNLKSVFGKNDHLDDPFDDALLQACRIKRQNVHEISYEDDHGLDSGAWYKFIKSDLWRDYDYVLFMGEGTLLTHPEVLGDAIQFATKHDAHFITGSAYKRYIPESWISDRMPQHGTTPTNGIQEFQDRMNKNTYAIFQRDPDFQSIVKLWRDSRPSGDTPQEHHIPDIWGRSGVFIERLVQRFPSSRLVHNRYLQYRNLWLTWFANMGFPFSVRKPLESSRVCLNFKMTNLSDVVTFESHGKTRFHRADCIGWFGTHCNHLISTTLLKKLRTKMDAQNIHSAMKLPYAATGLEPIWGLIPRWLGYDLWFFDGIHRVYKNFWTYKREDTQEGMARYLNHHYQGQLSVGYEGIHLKIHGFNRRYEQRLADLNELYFRT
tara:strand:+ start:6090 stop:7340 length:1251 start_codon:yes stop_codon:yes gene_type:complete